MKKNSWRILFFIVLAVNLFAAYNKNETLRYIFKPLLVIVLIVYFISKIKVVQIDLRKWILAALFFSWLGDVLLLFETKNSVFFLLGLSAFLIAHIFYIIFFRRIKMVEEIKSYWIILFIIAIYYSVLIDILLNHLGSMKLPVCIYGFVISIMLMLSMHMLYIKNRSAGWLMMTGALFFVTSDSILAFDKFYHAFEFAEILIMLTYGLAQWLITEGAIKYIRRTQ